MGQVQNSHRGQRWDQKNYVEPTVVEVKLKITQNLKKEKWIGIVLILQSSWVDVRAPTMSITDIFHIHETA